MMSSHGRHLVGWALALTTAACTVCTAAPRTDSQSPPLTLVATIELPDVAEGPYSDHLALDVPGHRIFATPQASKSVVVADLDSGKVIYTIADLKNPHAVLYRPDNRHLYVTDGDAGAVKIYDGTDYHLLKSIDLKRGADGIAYDEARGILYVANGGAAAHEEAAVLSVIDTNTDDKGADIQVPVPKLEEAVLDPDGRRLYVDLPLQSQVAVIDRGSGVTLARWPVPGCDKNMSLAQDPHLHRLYVACRNTPVRGALVVLDDRTGRRVDSLPAPGWIDNLGIDFKRGRIYASSGFGEVATYQLLKSGRYRELAATDTAVMAKTSLYSAALDRLFVSVPRLGFSFDRAKVLVFQPTDR